MQYIVLQPTGSYNASFTGSIATSSEPSRSISNASSNLTSQSSGNQQLSSVTVPSPVGGSFTSIQGQMQGMVTGATASGAPSGGFQLEVVSEAPAASYTQQQQQPQPQPLDYQQAWVASQSQGYMQQPGQQQQQLCYVQPQQQQQQQMLPQGSAPMYVVVQPTFMQQPNVQQQQDAAQQQQQQQQQASQVAMCYPVASGALLPEQQVQHDLQALSLQHTDNAGAAGLDLAQTLSLPAQYIGPGAMSPVMQGAAVPAAAGTSSGPISGGMSGILMASGVHDGSHSEVLQSGCTSPVDPGRLNMSLPVTPRVPLQQCIDVLSPQLNNASRLSGANITMLVGEAAIGAGGTGETIMVSITGTQQQVTAAWQLATSSLQQPALAEVAVLEQS
jgi:hypothetical protein